MPSIETVRLKPRERALAKSMCWDLDELSKKDFDERQQFMETMGQLTELLIKRNAIPAHRIEYFTNPKRYIGGYGKSRKDGFERSGVTDNAIFRDSDFLKYLKYFINGPDLPADAIKGFCKIITEKRGTSGMVLDQITAFVRKEIRTRKLDKRDAAEEFFKLAYELNEPRLAEPVRSAAMSVR